MPKFAEVTVVMKFTKQPDNEFIAESLRRIARPVFNGFSNGVCTSVAGGKSVSWEINQR